MDLLGLTDSDLDVGSIPTTRVRARDWERRSWAYGPTVSLSLEWARARLLERDSKTYPTTIPTPSEAMARPDRRRLARNGTKAPQSPQSRRRFRGGCLAGFHASLPRERGDTMSPWHSSWAR